MTLTSGSLFAGVGGFDAGFEQSGIETQWMVELDPKCRDVLALHWPKATILADVRDCGAHNLSPVDIITFGSPCTDLSVAGRRAGLHGSESGLFFEACRIIDELKPTLAVWENVPGAFSSNDGRDFATVLHALRELGARDIGWTTLNAQYFGVAQRRRRVFVVADFTGERAAEILFESEGLRWHPATRCEAGQDVAATLGGGTSERSRQSRLAQGVTEGEDDVYLSDVVSAVNGPGGKPGQGYAAVLEPNIANTLSTPRNGGGYSPEQTFITKALTTSNQRIDFETETFITEPAPILDAARGDYRGQSMGVGREGEPMFTLTSMEQHGIAGQQWGVRRLTPVECERLQGFPDGWTAKGASGAEIADGPRYRMMGNAVCVSVSAWLGQRIAAVLEQQKEGAA